MSDQPSSSVSPQVRALHVVTLSAFAIAQPLLSLLPKRTVFLHDFQPRWPEMIGLAVIVMVVLPTFFALIDRFVGRLTKTRLRWAADAVPFGLATLTAASVTRAVLDQQALQKLGLSWAICGACSIVAAMLWTWAYRRFEVMRQLLTVMSVALVIFPISFLWEIAPAIEAVERAATYEVRPAQHPVPVIMVVFDEFCGLALQNEDREIDAVRFPNFARLAGLSSWYRNGTANHGQTANALPTILTGVLQPNHPGTSSPADLFQLVRETNQFEMAVFEPVTRICSEEINPSRHDRRPVSQQLGTLCHVLAAVYPHLVLANDFLFELPAIPRDWFGVHAAIDENRGQRRGVMRYNWVAGREIQLLHFLDCISRDDKPLFAFQHVALPHFPWCFLPNGDHYVLEGQSPDIPNGTFNEEWDHNTAICQQSCERYLLQLGFLDRFIGQLLDRLQQTGMLDECLLIVTADHGVSFEPGHSRRKPEADTIGDVVSIPMFVKLPGQRDGDISDRNVESIDLLPTIADVVGLELRNSVDGSSLKTSDASQRPRKSLLYDDEMTVLEPQPIQPLKRLKEFWWHWRPGNAWEDWPTTTSRPELLGREVKAFRFERNPELQLNVYPGRTSSDAEKSQFVARFVQGEFIGTEENHFDVVCAVDGVIVAVAPLSDSTNTSHNWSLLLPASVVLSENSELEFFLWDEREQSHLVRFKSASLVIRNKRMQYRPDLHETE